MQQDLSLLLDEPDFSIRAVLEIEALAPLSMVAKMPGKYYRSQPKPTDHMLWGMLENALGWHISDAERKQLFAKLKKQHKLKDVSGSGVGYQSLLQWHVRFGLVVVPPLMHYDDLWIRHARDRGKPFIGGSRNYDAQIIPFMNFSGSEENKIRFSDSAKADKSSDAINSTEIDREIHYNTVGKFFPQYYQSPTPREYVEPQSPYMVVVETSDAMMQLLHDAVDNPAAPLYLGSNDGWVELNWQSV